MQPLSAKEAEAFNRKEKGVKQLLNKLRGRQNDAFDSVKDRSV